MTDQLSPSEAIAREEYSKLVSTVTRETYRKTNNMWIDVINDDAQLQSIAEESHLTFTPQLKDAMSSAMQSVIYNLWYEDGNQTPGASGLFVMEGLLKQAPEGDLYSKKVLEIAFSIALRKRLGAVIPLMIQREREADAADQLVKPPVGGPNSETLFARIAAIELMQKKLELEFPE